MKETLAKKVWSKSGYYEIARKGSIDFDHPAMKKLVELAKDSKVILDMGCGEGTRLSKLIKGKQKGYGVDISSRAIEIAGGTYPKLNFEIGDLEKLPYENGKFDLVYLAFVFEHLDNPEKVISEGFRVLKKGGHFLIVAPNFGSPNRASPPFTGNRLVKLIRGLVRDFMSGSQLSWQKVKPISVNGHYEMDWDTTIEPYLGSLLKFMEKNGFKIDYYSSAWSEEAKNTGFSQKIIKYLGEHNIYPFKLWGPHMVLIVEK